MSLDVYLTLPDAQPDVVENIFVREGGQNRRITRAEWDARYPDTEPFTVAALEDEAYHANITHNLTTMAHEAHLYQALWHPEELGFPVVLAEHLIAPLRAGLLSLQRDPDRFRQFNPSNGWGSYEGLVRFVADYLAACEHYPNAQVRVSR